ncbi:MAG TPA: flagellar biosynthesis anti-sigma factor FlgM [Polyangia bacterium]
MSAPAHPLQAGPVNSPARIEELRKLVAAGRYQVNPRFLATKILHAASVKLPE